MSGHDSQLPNGDNLFTSLIIAAGVILTVVMAIMLSLSDSQQLRVPAPVGPTVVAESAVVTPIPPTAPLPTTAPSATSTSTPQPEPTMGNQATPTVASTAVAVLAAAPCGNIPDGWVAYIIQSGDNLLKLSATSGATPSEISQANCLDLSVLLAGSDIYLPPVPPERPQCGPPIWWVRYLVRRGNTLYSLARSHGTTVFAIMQANCLESSRIFAGRSLFLPPTIIVPTRLPTATSTLTPSPTPSPTSVPSATPVPAASATPTTAPLATLTPTGTATASASPSVTPTDTPTPTATNIAPTATATPSPTSVPTATETQTPRPTDTPSPTATHTALPTATSTPTSSATSTSTPIPADASTPTAG